MFLPGRFYTTPLKRLICKNQEVMLTALLKPSLNEQKNV